jgi:Putative porin
MTRICRWACFYSILLLGASAARLGAQDHLKFFGDLRYRHDLVDQEGKDQRTRHRIRARIGLGAQLGESIDLGFQLATGSDNPISTNQTLGDGFSSKNIVFDLAYFDWHPTSVEGFHLVGGKMKNPFYMVGKTEMIWDSDLRLEGLATKIAKKNGNVEVFATMGNFWVDENKSGEDPMLWAIQGGLKFLLGENGTHLLTGLSYFDYSNAQGKATFYDPTDGFGNTMDADGNYETDFNELEIFAELVFKINKTPVSLFVDWVENTSADHDKKGWLAGYSIGKCKAPGSSALHYNYRKVEKNSLIGAFTDSDFGVGGTNSKGHEIGFDCQIGKRETVGVTYFYNKTVDLGSDCHKLLLDLNFKF